MIQSTLVHALVPDVDKFDIILAGVGGQGTIIASRIIGRAAVLAGLRVRGSELLGLSQRGGAVCSHVRFGTKVEAPMVSEGQGDMLLSFEPSEGLRHLRFLSRSGVILVNTKPIIPNTVSMGMSKYPELEHTLSHYRGYAATMALDATDLALQAGNPIAVNTVMIGAMLGTGRFPISRETLFAAIEGTVRKNLVDLNKKAFELGLGKTQGLLVQNEESHLKGGG